MRERARKTRWALWRSKLLSNNPSPSLGAGSQFVGNRVRMKSARKRASFVSPRKSPQRRSCIGCPTITGLTLLVFSVWCRVCVSLSINVERAYDLVAQEQVGVTPPLSFLLLDWLFCWSQGGFFNLA